MRVVWRKGLVVRGGHRYREGVYHTSYKLFATMLSWCPLSQLSPIVGALSLLHSCRFSHPARIPPVYLLPASITSFPGTAKPHHVVVDPDHPDAPLVTVAPMAAAATGSAAAAPGAHSAGAGNAQGGGTSRASGGGAGGGGGGGSGGVVLGYSHLGMLAAARWLLKQVTPLLRLALAANPGYQLRIVGECVNYGGGGCGLGMGN